MSNMGAIDPATYVVPDGQALLYTEVSGSETLYKYRFTSSSGTSTTAVIDAAVVNALGVKTSELPMLVYKADLLACLNETFATVAQLTIAASSKASIDYVKKVAATKLAKADFLTTISKYPTLNELETGLSIKANAVDVDGSLALKADKSNTYSKDDVNQLITTAVTNISVTADQITIVGDGTPNNPLAIASTIADKLLSLDATNHSHDNYSVLQKLSVDDSGNLLFDNMAIGGGTSSAPIDVPIESITVNGNAVTVSDKNANIVITTDTVTGLADWMTNKDTEIIGLNGAWGNIMCEISDLQESVDSFQSVAHIHSAENNYRFLDRAMACADTDGNGESFLEVNLPEDTETMESVKALNAHFVWVISGTPYYFHATVSKFTADPINYSVGATVTATNVIDLQIVSNQMAVIMGSGEGAETGTLWVRGLSNAKSNKGGSLTPDYSISTADWVQVGTDNTWSKITGFLYAWLALKKTASGGTKLYTAGHNACGLQANAGLDENGNPIYDDTTGFGVSILSGKAHLINELTEVKLSDDNGETWYEVDDWFDASCGCYHNMAIRGSAETGGTIYAWGGNHDGALGNGISYTHDMKTAYAWSDGTSVVYTLTTSPTTATNVYTDFATINKVEETVTAASTAAIVIGGVTYNRVSASDVYPYKVGNHVPQVVTLEDGTVYNDWKQISAGYYHSGALRYNENGESEVYLWGSSEYGQLGTGEYIDDAVDTSNLPEGINTTVKLYAYPHLLTDDEFPYKDVVEVKCVHYGTFLRRANGELYFAGFNKRNHFGTGKIVDGNMVIPKFTRLGSRFTNKELYVETYGALLINKSQRVADDADIAVKAVLADNFAAEHIQEALEVSHSHAIDINVIDAASILVNQYAALLPTACISAHGHSNKASLDAITIRNGNLFINNVLFTSTSDNSGGTTVIVDPTNVTLDDLANVEGRCNIAGGMPLEVIGYYPVSDTEAYMHIAPLGGGAPKFSRFVDIEVCTGTDSYSTVITKELQASGVYAVPSNSSSTACLIRSSADMKTVVDKLMSGSSGTITFYYLNGMDASNWKTGTVAATINRTDLAAGDLYFNDDNAGDHIPLADYVGPGLGNRQPEEKAFFDVYDLVGNLLVSEADFEYILTSDTTFVSGTVYYTKSGSTFTKATVTEGNAVTADTYYVKRSLYFEDGTAITSVGSMVSPTGTETVENDDGSTTTRNTYHSVYDGQDTSSANCLITEETMRKGIFRKEGSQYIQVRAFDIPEVWDDSLFENTSGGIYVYPGNSSFVGVANQYYEYNARTFVYGTTVDSITGEYPLESVVLRLKTKLTDYEETTSEPTFTPGLSSNPMVAAIASPNRAYTSHVTGEYNAGIGYNVTVSGNMNNVFGDYSTASGIANTVTGTFSFAHGTNNEVTGDNAFVVGTANSVACNGNIAFGDNNKAYGHYGILIGSNNRNYEVHQTAIGSLNCLYARNAFTVGTNNTIEKTATDTIAVGNKIDVYAKKALVIGQNGNVVEHEGNFPGTDTTVLRTLTSTSFGDGGYDTVGVCNNNGVFVVMGDPDGSKSITPYIPVAYSKYLWRPNNAYFGVDSSLRGSIDPYIYEPFYQWRFTGVMSMSFLTSTPKADDATSFDSSVRYGGRLKSCDPGLVVEAVSEVCTPYELDYRLATRWKFDNSHATSFICGKNFEDGAEASIVIYAGAEVYFDFDGGMAELPDDVNVFDAQIVSDCTGGDLTSVTAITEAIASASTGFVVVKLMVVDNVILCQVIANTLA